MPAARYRYDCDGNVVEECLTAKRPRMSGEDYTVSGRTIGLRLVNVDDAEFILELRLESTRNKHLSPVKNDLGAQRDWIDAYKAREAAGTEFYYIIVDTTGVPLGTVRLYDFQGPSFSWGSWLLKPGAPKVAAVESALLVYEIGFNKLGFAASHFEVRVENERVWAFHERMGATRTMLVDGNCNYKISRADFQRARQRYSRFL